MENGAVADLLDSEGAGSWENGQDLSLSQSEQLYSGSEPSVEQSVEPSPQNTYSPEYELGAFAGYELTDYGMLYGSGMGVGFAVAICVALAAWVVACAISILKKGGTVE